MSNLELVDSYSRKIGSLRVSLTDRCNMRCKYCLPEHPDFMESSKLLTPTEIIRMVNIFAKLGVTKVRLTGGEPLLRSEIVQIVEKIRKIAGIKQVTLTTNGLLLAKYAKGLKEAGLDNINISLDTLDPEKFAQITGRKNHAEVLDAIMLMKKLEIPTKVNCVSFQGVNIDELFDFVNFSHENEMPIRFIEFMPFAGNSWSKEKYVSNEILKNSLLERYELTPIQQEKSSTSTLFEVKGTKAKIGFISSVSNTFCATCNRVRLTADGNIRPCLHHAFEVPLRYLLRNEEISDERIVEEIVMAIKQKSGGHSEFRDISFNLPTLDRSMTGIGG